MKQARLPSFGDPRLPKPLPPAQTFRIHAVAVAALAVSLAYLTWRVFFTMNLAAWWVSIPFLLLEVHGFVSLALFAFSLWDIDSRPRVGSVRKPRGRIAVLIPTYNEPREVLLPTIAAAVSLWPAHETWVLDDGQRDEVRTLAGELGVRYLTRSERTGAKAGNINNALRVIEADFIAILDADHVADANFLRRTLGYFRDPRIALVQTPQDFYNLDSFEHETAAPGQERQLYNEQQLFYRAIQPGKNRWGGAFWCGTGAVVRVEALRDVGGVATDTLTEDIHTTIRMHRRGWKTVYHNEILARGLAARTAEQFQLQRFRWGAGAMQVLRKENPLTSSGLSIPQRIAYAATLFGWFDSWRSLGYMLLPVVVLYTGAMPLHAHPVMFALAFGATFLLQQVALRMLSRGYHRLILSIVFDLVRMSPNALATLTLVWPRRPRFQVTPKGRESQQERRRTPAPPLLLALTGLSAGAATWFIGTVFGFTPTVYEDTWFAAGASFWLALNLALILIAIKRVSAPEYAPERRDATRFATGLPATFDGRACLIHELSLTGAQISFPAAGAHHLSVVGKRYGITIGVLKQGISLGATVPWHHVTADGKRVLAGLHFEPGQTAPQARLALALLNNQLPTTKKPEIEQAAA